MQSTLTLDDLIALGRSRWALPLLADLAAHRGARFVELVHRLGMPRDSLARTLASAIDSGWVMRSSGHGHPLRPEYLLTDEGVRLAAGSLAISRAQMELGLAPGSLTRWGMPLILAIGSRPARFNELTRRLAPATPRAISQGLLTLTANVLVERELIDHRPPATRYRLTPSGVILAQAT